MVRKSKGSRQGSRKKMKKRGKRKTSISKVMSEFSIGDKVHVTIDPSIQKGMPHPRFQGRTGEIIEERGKAYVVRVKDGSSFKKIVVRPEHLKLQRCDRDG